MKIGENNLYHESAVKHVTGKSIYVNDIDVGKLMLYGKVVYSPHSHAIIKSIDFQKALEIDGVHAILTYKEIPGDNQMGPVFHDEHCLAENKVTFIGQAVALIAAESIEIARSAEKLIDIIYEPLHPIVTLEEAIEKNQLLSEPRIIERGCADDSLRSSEHIIKGTLKTGAQEHWYLETQSSLCLPIEDDYFIYSSTQHPSETQAIVAEVLGINRNRVVVEVKRMGGGFGGKETQGNHVAAWASLLSYHTKRPVKIHLFRDDDQIMTGKRHRFISNYEIGFDNEGLIKAYKVELNSDAGACADLSMAILERAVFHADNSYYIPNISVVGRAWITNLPPNTAFRGFGGPQGMAVIENAIDIIARFLKKDPADIRFSNFYQNETKNTTHYEQQIKNNRLLRIYEQLIVSSNYSNRRNEIFRFNDKNEFYKKGIALTPVKFGISFTTSFLNQAGALINIYQDGTVQVNHGGTEMGQGLHTKILGIAAKELGISVDKIKINYTDTSKVPNTSATAASSGSDMNGMAVKNSIDTLKNRLIPIIIEELIFKYPELSIDEKNIVFENNNIFVANHPQKNITFIEIINKAYLKRISLSSTGYYSTPNLYFDKQKGRGNPFHYYAFGMAVSEVIIDTLTGAHKILRTDILHDTGNSLNESIDIGQIQGGFIQGVGLCTTEVIKWDDNGKLLNHSPDTYKIPSVQDIPHDFRVELLKEAPNSNTIHNSKAVGEPPFMLAFSVWLAIKDAISAVGNHKFEPDFELPANNEVILKSIEKIKKLIK